MDGRSATRVFPEFKELLSIFNAHSVKYLIVGGYAVGFHAQPRATKDLDIWVKPDPENAKSLYEALGEFGAPLEGLTVADFAEPGEFFRIGHEPVMVDLLPEITGVEFDQAWKGRVNAVVDVQTGVRAFFISAKDLITSKLAAGRPQDMADAEAVRSAEKKPGD
jgi:hypothetical protein